MLKSYWIASCILLSASLGLGFPAQEAWASGDLDISITNEGYEPQVVRVTPGTAVTWTNLEGVHTSLICTTSSLLLFSLTHTSVEPTNSAMDVVSHDNER